MNLFDRLLGGARNAVLLSEKVDRLTRDVQALGAEVREQDRRLVRIETMLAMYKGDEPPQPPRLPHRRD